MTPEQAFAQDIRAAFLRYRDQVDPSDERAIRRVRNDTGVLIGVLSEIEFYRNEGNDV